MERELRARGAAAGDARERAAAVATSTWSACSLQYEMTYTNVLTLLDLGGIPLRAADRGETRSAGHRRRARPRRTPSRWRRSSTRFLIGEAEEVLPELLLY